MSDVFFFIHRLSYFCDLLLSKYRSKSFSPLFSSIEMPDQNPFVENNIFFSFDFFNDVFIIF